MASVLIESIECSSHRDVRYRCEMRLERVDGEPIWIVELTSTPPEKLPHIYPRPHPSRAAATNDYDKFVSLFRKIDDQRLGVEANGQIALIKK